MKPHSKNQDGDECDGEDGLPDSEGGGEGEARIRDAFLRCCWFMVLMLDGRRCRSTSAISGSSSLPNVAAANRLSCGSEEKSV